ncbi:MAG TPA: hypothetical protein VFT62_10255 [Mycobacteriales bacterium]|nr:hypothetical protein [Mycobacteriales bacterium]
MPDLRWADVETMPVLRRLAERSAVAELSVKTVSGVPRCPDGLLTFSAGNRVDALGTSTECAIQPEVLATIRRQAVHEPYAAHVGAFGQALHDAGLTTAAVGSAAVPLLADGHGHVDATTSDLPSALRRGDVVATVVDTLYYAPTQFRLHAAELADQEIARQLATVPSGTTVMVAGISDGQVTRMHLHVLLVHGPGWRHVALHSSSTRPPYVQLRDLAPTILTQLGVPVPATMIGAPATESGQPARSPASYADDDDHAVTGRTIGGILRTTFTQTALGVLLLLVFGYALPRRWAPQPWRGWARVAVRLLGAACVGAPVCSFLVNVFPWWRWGAGTYPLLLIAGSLLIGAGVLLAARRGLVAALLVGPAVTAAILIADQFAGAPLQLSAPLGDSPIVAGRFHGMGNTDFALMCTAMLVVAGLVAGQLHRRGRPRLALMSALALGAFATVVDAAPRLGDDFGGVLTMVPTVAILVLLLAGVRLSWQRVAAVVVGAAVLATGVALLDYSRPAPRQTHVGRFVGQVLHGGAGGVLNRKLGASLASFQNAALTSLVVVTIIAAILFRRELVAMLRQVPGLPATAVAVAVLAFLGTFLNDSGVVVAAFADLLVIFTITAAGACRAAATAGPRENGTAVPPPAPHRSPA